MQHDDDGDDEHRWPDDLLNAAEVRAWIARQLPAADEVIGPIVIHQAKE